MPTWGTVRCSIKASTCLGLGTRLLILLDWDMSDSIPLESALARLLFSEEGVSTWHKESIGFSRRLEESIENRLELRISMSA